MFAEYAEPAVPAAYLHRCLREADDSLPVVPEKVVLVGLLGLIIALATTAVLLPEIAARRQRDMGNAGWLASVCVNAANMTPNIHGKWSILERLEPLLRELAAWGRRGYCRSGGT